MLWKTRNQVDGKMNDDMKLRQLHEAGRRMAWPSRKSCEGNSDYCVWYGSINVSVKSSSVHSFLPSYSSDVIKPIRWESIAIAIAVDHHRGEDATAGLRLGFARRRFLPEGGLPGRQSAGGEPGGAPPRVRRGP